MIYLAYMISSEMFGVCVSTKKIILLDRLTFFCLFRFSFLYTFLFPSYIMSAIISPEEVAKHNKKGTCNIFIKYIHQTYQRLMHK